MRKISVVIPARPEDTIKAALTALKRINYPKELIEAYLTFGYSPSQQRNLAVRKSRGDVIYFLDSDSQVSRNAFREAVAIFNKEPREVRSIKTRGFSFFPDSVSNYIRQKFFSGQIYGGEIGAVGGPNIWEGAENFWASISSVTLESFFALALMAARHRPIGPVHRASEKELILCNMAVSRKVFNAAGGFNETLYPNEENELLNRIEKKGYQLVYHPAMIVKRPRRQSLSSLLSAFYNYGRGRMEQIRLEGVLPSLPLMAPLLLIIYLSLVVAVILGTDTNGFINLVLLCPIIIYLLMSLGSAIGSALRKNKAYLVFFLPVMFFVVHLTYALGLIGGLFSNLKKRRLRAKKAKIKIIKLKDFDGSWQKYDCDRIVPWSD